MTISTGHTDKPLRVLFAGGGTGGHLAPALAIAQTLQRQDARVEILFIGTADRLEARIVPAAGYAFRAISVHGLAGRWTITGLLQRLRGVAELVSGLPFWQALRIIKQFRPQVVVGSGGYVCGPVLAAAKFSGRPALLMEQNEEIGNTSRMVARYIQLAAVISAPSGAYFRARGIRTEVVGNPVRPAILSTTREQGLAALGLQPNRLTLSVCGGSLGSSPINNAFSQALHRLALLDWFREEWQVVHLAGPQRGGELGIEEAAALGLSYTAYSFLDNIADVIAASDAVITRAGGTFLAEVAVRGVPLVIIPWAGAASDHQTRNAIPFVDAGAAILITDADLNGDRLYAALLEVLPDASRRAAMADACRKLGNPDAAERIVGFIKELAGRA